MVKLHGARRWRKSDYRTSIFDEVMALEIRLDGLHQKSNLSHTKAITVSEIELSKMLGMARSALALIKSRQKTLKRFIKPAPNQKDRTRGWREND